MTHFLQRVRVARLAVRSQSREFLRRRGGKELGCRDDQKSCRDTNRSNEPPGSEERKMKAADLISGLGVWDGIG